MKRLLLVFLASMFLSGFATHTPDYPSSKSSSFTLIPTDGMEVYTAQLPGKQVRFLPDGIVSIAEYRRIGREEVDPNSPLIAPLQSEYEVMIYNWQWESSEHNIPELDPATGHLWYRDIHQGIHLTYYFTENGMLKYDVIADPGSNPDLIQATLDGAEFRAIDRKGRLVIDTPWGKTRDEAPISFVQERQHLSTIGSAYKLTDKGRLTFDVEFEPNKNQSLIIDPLTMSWSTFLHSPTSDDYVIAVIRDDNNFLYAAGYTETPSFPVTSGVYQGTFGGIIDAYVSKLGPNGDYLVWSTYLGGSDWDMAYALDIDAQGNLYVGGYTASSDFPVTQGANQEVMRGMSDGFITQLSPDGVTLGYSTYVGGTDRDYLYDLVCTDAGEVYFIGYTFSYNFPTTSLAFDQSYNGYGDGFLGGLTASGNALLFSTFLGGTGFDMAQSLDRAPNGELAVVGNTNSLNLPLINPLQNTLNLSGGNATDDGFFLRFNTDASQLLTGTYIGGSDSDGLYAVKASSAGQWFMAGNTNSTNLMTTSSAWQKNYQGSGDVFLTRLDASGTSVVYSTYLGGSDVDYVKAIAVESDDELYVLGASRSTDWYVSGGLYGPSGQYDAFLTHVTADGSAINSSTLLGGSYNDYPRSPSSLDLSGNLISMAITTHSQNVQSAGNGYQQTKLNGLSDAPWLVGFEGDVLLPPDTEAVITSADPLLPELKVTKTAEFWTWQLKNTSTQAQGISLWDVSGRQVFLSEENGDSGLLHLPHLARGTYLLQVVTEDGKKYRNRIIQ